MISRIELTHGERERDRTVAELSNVPDVGRVQDTGYHSVPSRDATALEDDPAREYGDFDAGDRVCVHRDVDAGRIHTDSGRDAGVDEDRMKEEEERNFGGENTEYHDNIAPEDDDERYGEALPEELGGRDAVVGGGGDVEYSDTIGSGEPVDVTQSQAVFPGSDDY
ncbi:hypothetical protein EIP91_010739 [Steccherinum ochraceum]|uniref:Uncharacterized protein n=1 Tax=Steccherinum ochraceum TaxID=92696 RepID=A0A4R0RN32_9APHY|nr:hypothetical protein EIP91_010739 [Steccherinum ochraceum]